MLIFPVFMLYWGLSRSGRSDSVFSGFSQTLSLIPGKIGIYVRAAFYHLTCPGTSDEISIGFLTLLSHRDTTIKRGVYIGPQCNIGKCTIREDTLIGSGVHILSGNRQHHFDDPNTPIQKQGGTYRKITIGVDCWIGNGATVMADVPDHCMIAAGSVMTKQPDVQGAILGGNPAKQISQRPLPEVGA